MNTLDTVCAFAAFLVASGELAVARKWVRFSITFGTTAAPKGAAKKKDAAGQPVPEAAKPLEVAA
jgi:hypothetical protein